jgi:RNA polymerase sigma factor FliA
MGDNVDKLWLEYWKNRSSEAKEKIIVHYIELVKVISGRLFSTYSAHIEFDDLVSYGALGLIDAIDKFDSSKKVKFETYATFRIKGSIIDQIRSLDWIPRSKRQKFKALDETLSRLQNEYGHEINDELVASEMSITSDELSELYGEMSTVSIVSLDEKISENSSFNIRTESVSDSPDMSFEREEMKGILGGIIDCLGEKEKLVITLYYYEELTYKEISRILNITESRISQIHSKAIMTMRSRMNCLMKY